MPTSPRVCRANRPKVDLETLVSRQRGLLTRGQALAAGLDDDAIARALREERWQRMLPGLYATFSGDPTVEHQRLAAALYTRGRGQLTGVAALRWHGFRQLPEERRMHVLVPHRYRRASRDFVLVQRSHELDPSPIAAKGYVVCSIPRAVVDACRRLDEIRAVRSVVAESVQRGLTSIEALERETERAGRSRTRLLHRALREVGAGGRSAPEIDLQRILDPTDLASRVMWNATLLTEAGDPLPVPDGWLPDAGIALEVDSREYHLSPEDWQRTMRRHNLLAAHGVLVLHFTPSELRSRPGHVRQLIVAAYAQRLAGGTPVRVRTIAPTVR